MIETQIVADLPALDGVAASWHRMSAVGATTPFQTFHWTRAWWSLIGQRDRKLQLRVLVLRHDRRVCSIAPFMVRAGDPPTLTFATHPWADYADVLVDPRLVPRELVYAVLADHIRAGLGATWHRVVLDELPPWSSTRLQFDGTVRVTEEAASMCPRLDLDDATQVADRSAGRGEHAVKRRRLQRSGELRFTLHCDAVAIGERMPTFMAMHLRQWLPRPHRGLTFDTEEFLRFYPGAVAPLADAGLLALAELTLDGRPLAFHLGFIHRDAFWCYRTTFDVAARHCSPGHLLHQEMIRALAADGYRTLDFMRGDYPFKREYADHLVQNHRWIVEASGGAGA